MFEVIQYLGSLKVVFVESLPRIDFDELAWMVVTSKSNGRHTANPTALLHGQVAHVYPVLGLDKATLLVCVADSTEVGATNFVVGIETSVV